MSGELLGSAYLQSMDFQREPFRTSASQQKVILAPSALLENVASTETMCCTSSCSMRRSSSLVGRQTHFKSTISISHRGPSRLGLVVCIFLRRATSTWALFVPICEVS